MPHELPILNQVQIPSPCPASWNAVTGDEKERHCQQCDKSVFHLSHMTAREAARIVEEHRGNLCARIARRKSDGTIVTQAERSWLQSMRRVICRVVATVVIVPFLSILPGCSKEDLPEPIAEWTHGNQPEDIEMLSGEVVELGGLVAEPIDQPESAPAPDGD